MTISISKVNECAPPKWETCPLPVTNVYGRPDRRYKLRMIGRVVEINRFEDVKALCRWAQDGYGDMLVLDLDKRTNELSLVVYNDWVEGEEDD